jgi:hypothetical protein
LESGQKERGEGNAKKVCLEMNTIPMRQQVHEICCWYQQKKGGEKRGGGKELFFFLSRSLYPEQEQR